MNINRIPSRWLSEPCLWFYQTIAGSNISLHLTWSLYIADADPAASSSHPATSCRQGVLAITQPSRSRLERYWGLKLYAIMLHELLLLTVQSVLRRSQDNRIKLSVKIMTLKVCRHLTSGILFYLAVSRKGDSTRMNDPIHYTRKTR